MAISDMLGDMLTRIRNGQHARKAVIEAPASKLGRNVLEVLKREGFIRDYRDRDVRPGVKMLDIELKYADGRPVIKEMARISKPGRRVYRGTDDMPRIYNGMGIAILSTSHGVMSDHDARAMGVGGEVLCRVF